MKVENASEWPLERVMEYFPDIAKSWQKLVRRFPDDITVECLFRDYMTGKKALWLILEDDGTYVGTCMTRMPTNELGKKIAGVMDLSAENHRAFGPELNKQLEQWALDHGADYCQIEGRPGWAKQAKKYGYVPYLTIWRKKVKNGQQDNHNG